MSLPIESLFFLVPILAVSVYAVALILQKVLQTRRYKPLASAEFDRFADHLQTGQSWLKYDLTLRPDHPLLVVLQAGRKERARRAQQELSRYEDRIAYLPILANVATLLGLFGTVSGMILSFLALRAGGGADPASLAGGIAQSLLATALGLTAAVPCLGFHAYLQRRSDLMAEQLEIVLNLVEDDFRARF